MEHSNGRINHVSLGGRLFVKYHPREELQQNEVCVSEDIAGYWGFYEFKTQHSRNEEIDLDGLAPAYFISNLVEFILRKKKRRITAGNRFWFLFPLERGKTPHQIGVIDLPKPQ